MVTQWVWNTMHAIMQLYCKKSIQNIYDGIWNGCIKLVIAIVINININLRKKSDLFWGGECNSVAENWRLVCVFLLIKTVRSIPFTLKVPGLSYLNQESTNLRIIRSMHFQVQSCVKCCNTYSEYFKCAIDLKQGEVIPRYYFNYSMMTVITKIPFSK